MKQPILLAVLAALAFFSSCRKDDLQQHVNPSTPAPPATAANMKDSALLYSKDIYLWYDQIPGSLNAGSFADISGLMTNIRQYSSEPGFSGPVDRWSFAIPQQQWDNVSSGISGDFGLNVFFRAEGDLRVRHVEKTSPAGLAGVRRGWRITAINGNTNIVTGNADFIVENVYNSSGSTFTFLKPDNSSITLSLNAAIYGENPVVLDSVYQTGGKRIGYFSFNSFLGDTGRVYNEFARIFNRFAAAGVQDLVVDLRYNGGGYVSVAQKLTNWLAPSSANGQLMMKQLFNGKYTQYNEDEYIRKQGSLNLDRIFFIVSNSTASASELLINNLRPYMDVQLVGPSKTYGKPVGYFPIPVGSWYIFPVSFRSTNKNGEGNYFGGIQLHNQGADGLDKDWGDLGESSLQSAINYITTGAYRSQSINSTGTGASPALQQSNRTLDTHFKGTVDTRGLR